MNSSETWVVYGLRSTNSSEVRYVGKTSKKLSTRLYNHMYDARMMKRPRHVLHWINEIGADNIEAVVLEQCPIGDDEYIAYAEKYWILCLREFGNRLTNLTDGGEGTSGYIMAEWQRQAISDRMVGKFAGTSNPMYGVRGPAHPMFGLRGVDHPGYGYKAPPERLRQMSIISTGRMHTEATKRKMSAAQKGKPKSEETKMKLKVSAHNYHHVQRGIIKESCTLCAPTTEK